MRKITILTAVFALLAFLAIPMGMWGQATTYTSNVTLPLSGTNVSSCKVIISGTQYDGTKFGKSNTGASANVTIPAGTTTLYVHCAAWNGKSSKLALSTTTSGVSITPNGDWTLTSDSGIANNSPFTLASPDKASTDYFREYTLTGVTSDISVKFEVKNERAVLWGVNAVAGSTPTIATPTFTPAGGDYPTTQNVTISCETQGATIYYTTDGSTPDNTSTEYTDGITVSETTTIKAIAYVGSDASSVASATYTIMQPLTTMQAIYDKATEVGNTATSVYITLGNWVVSGVSTNGKNVFVTDGTKGFVIYDNGGNTGFAAGNVLSGTVYCKVQLYNGFAEVTLLNATTSGISVATGGTVSVANIAMADLIGVNTGALVHYDNLTCSVESNKYYLSDGTTTIQVYNSLYAFGSVFMADHVYNITGVYQQYTTNNANTKEVLPRSADDIVEVTTGVPIIDAENVSIACDATSGAIEYSISNEPNPVGVLTAATTAEWLTIGTVGETVPFTCTANSESTARTATVTLTYTYNTNQTVTKDVTVTQAAYEAPHYTWNLSIDQTATATTTEMTWTSNYATMAVVKANATTNTNNYYPGTPDHNYTSTRFYKDSELTLAPVAGYSIDSVVFTATSTNYASAFVASTWTNATAVAKGTTVTVTPADGTANIVAVIGGTCGFTAVTVYYEENNNPSIIANNVEIAYNATSGSIVYTINNEVTGGVLTAATTAEWITLGTVGATVPFTTTVNEAGINREGVVTLTYTYNRASVTKDVTVTQTGNPAMFNNISDITEVGTAYSVRGTVVATNSRGFIMGDGTGYVYYYKNGAVSQSVGDMVTISGTTGTYGQIIQFTNSATVGEATTSNYNGAPASTLILEVPDYTQGYHLSDYLEYEGTLTKDGSNYLITLDTAQIQISYPTTGQISALTPLVSKNVHVKGYFSGINSSGRFTTMLESVEEVISTTSSITVNPTTVNVPCAAAEDTLTVIYENINMELGPEIYWYEADGETPATYDWVSVSFDENNNVIYTITANTGAARKAYMKVYGISSLDESDVYSSLITFSQGHYIPDFATLPFDFDGGRADIANTYGLTQNGLGTDYNSSPKLKFDHTGDWMILHFNAEPGQLIYSIKGNTFSGGTFTVQTSADGETYNNLAVYTELGATDTVEFDLGANVRYIKWIYTEKGNGNVALGNIHVTLPSTAPVITVTPALVELDADATDDVLEVTYRNITTVVAEIYWYEADGETPATYDWLSATIDEDNNVYYVIDANEGAARTAYLKVYALSDDAQDVYSDLVTITQAAFVPPFTPVTYTLASSMESGRHYIIVGFDGEDAYAMGGQNDHNRAAVPITIVDDVAQVNSADVCEFVFNIVSSISDDSASYGAKSAECTGSLNPSGIVGRSYLYTIYDATSMGYLYAASSTANHLKTETHLDANNNGLWFLCGSPVAQGTNTKNILHFNSSSKLFSCYASGQQEVYYYVKNEEEPQYDFYKDIAGYGESEGGYYLLATPTTDNADPIEAGMITEGSTYDLYGFDYQASDEEWQNYKVENTEVQENGLAFGKGYLYANQNNVTLHFQGAPTLSTVTEQTIALQYESDANCWNLVGNPLNFMAYIWNNDFYVLNDLGTEVVLANRDYVDAMEGIFVKATATVQSITFHDTYYDDWEEPFGILNLSIYGSNGSSDFARIRFGEGQDLEKLMLNENHTKLYFPVNGGEFAVVYAANESEMPLNFKPEANGIYTLSIDAEHVEIQYLHLIDNLTGEDIDLLANPSYKFEASVYDNAARFTLVVRK